MRARPITHRSREKVKPQIRCDHAFLPTQTDHATDHADHGKRHNRRSEAITQPITPITHGGDHAPHCLVQAGVREPRPVRVAEKENIMPADRPAPWRGRPVGRAAINAAKTRCWRDHPLDDDANVYRWTDRDGSTHRRCRECKRIREGSHA